MMKKKNNQNNSSTNQLEKSTSIYLESITLLFIISLLVIDFFPQFGSIEITAPQCLYLSVINILAGFFILQNQDIISNGLVATLKKSILVKVYFIFFIICGLSLFLAPNLSLAIFNFRSITIFFSTFLILSTFLYNRLDLFYKIAFLVGISVLIQSLLALNNFIGIAKSTGVYEALISLKGNTGNINIHSASLVGKLPFLLIGILHFTDWKKWLLLFTFLLGSLNIFLVAARASYISLFIVIVSFIALYIKFNDTKKNNLKNISYLIIPIAMAFIIGNVIFTKVTGYDRYKSIFSRVTQITETQDDSSINTRFTYWENAVKVKKKNPISGIGLGNWKVEAMPYERLQANNLLVSDHPHNDFLEIAAETGILNAVIYILIFIFGAFLNLKNIVSNKQNEKKVIASIALLLLACYTIDALFNFPLYRPTMQINFCFFLVLTVLNSNPIEITQEFRFKKTITLILIIFSLGTLYFSYCTFKAYQLMNDTRVDMAQDEAKYKLTANEIIKRLPKFPDTQTNSQPFVELAAIYSLKEKNYPQAVKYFNLSHKINPHTGRTEWYKYRMHKELGNKDSTYYYAMKALEIRPRNESYYYSAIDVEVIKKDTLGVLNIHNEFIKYVNEPNIWLNTSSALALSNYSSKGLIKFIDKALTEFPKDTTLSNRKKSFLNDALIKQNNVQKAINVAPKTNYLALASQYGAENKFDKALLYYKKALIEDPNNIAITQNIGICYFKTNQFKSAILYLEKTLNSPTLTDGKTEFILGACYLNTNNKEKGCHFIKIADGKKYAPAKDVLAQFCK